MSDISREDALAHFGVMGMKWGVRKAQNRATNMTNKQIQIHRNAVAGKGLIGVAAKLDKHTWGGNGRFEGYHAKRIAELENSKKRIEDGELIAMTLLFGPRYSKR